MYVKIFGKIHPEASAEFEEHLRQQCVRLRIDLRFNPHDAYVDESGVALVFAQASGTWTAQDEQSLEALAASDSNILPVIVVPDDAKFLPKSISRINAFVTSFFGSAWVECLVDEILSMTWLHRRVPKVFISYKRTDSSEIASQIYDRLSHLGYETFLDEASVPRGADFQRELKWWLNDADLLLVLASPRFPTSKWCMEEVSFCQQRFIGIAVVEWPRAIFEGEQRLPFPGVDGHQSEPIIIQRAQPSQITTLALEDFAGLPAQSAGRMPTLDKQELTSDGLAKVLKLCVEQRTVGIKQRLNNLIPLASHLLGARRVPGRNPTDLSFEEGGIHKFLRVLPFRPRPENIRQACIDGAKLGERAGCFYAENDPFDPRAESLRWLANGTRPPNDGISDGWLWASFGASLWQPGAAT